MATRNRVVHEWIKGQSESGAAMTRNHAPLSIVLDRFFISKGSVISDATESGSFSQLNEKKFPRQFALFKFVYSFN
jgi:hypothetical protein